jgi:hypothetical protein
MVGYWFKSSILSFILFFFVLAFIIKSIEQSPLPFKVGDKIKLIQPMYNPIEQKAPPSFIFEIKEIKGKWLHTGDGLWVNSDLYLCVDIYNF